MSTSPNIPEPGLANLRRALQHMPLHEPNPTVWAGIEAQLAADDALAKAVPALPQHQPDEALWERIAAQLDTASGVAEAQPIAEQAVVRPLWPARAVRRIMAVAASLLLLLGIWRQWHPATVVTHETLVYSEEVVPVMSFPAPAVDPLEEQGLSFIDAHCSSLPTVCQTGEFHTLRSQLIEVEAEEQRLRQDVRRFGASPELLRQQARLTALKASLTRELVQLLIS